VSLLAVVTLRQAFAGAAGVDQSALLGSGHALVAVRDWTFSAGPTWPPASTPSCSAPAPPCSGSPSRSQSGRFPSGPGCWSRASSRPRWPRSP